jgi:hypothetical protein
MKRKKYCVISIDVEPDSTSNWHYRNPLSFQGVREGIGHVLHPLFLKHGVSPTYLINNVVLEDDDSVEVLATLKGNYELGTHLHPEFINPQKSIEVYAGAKGVANCIDYSPDIEFEKIRSITKLFVSQFGYNPVSYRGGRFSARSDSLQFLNSLGYLVDSSATPYIVWDDITRKNKLDYSKANHQPCFTRDFVSCDNTREAIFEVPISIVPTNKLDITTRLKNPFLLRNKNIWMRPSSTSVREFKALVNFYERQHNTRDLLTLNMMFHNVEVIPYNSPYSLTVNKTENIINRLGDFIKYLADENYQFVTMKELRAIYTNNSIK